MRKYILFSIVSFVLVISSNAQDIHGSMNIGLGKGIFSVQNENTPNFNYEAETGLFYETNIALVLPINFGIGLNFSQNKSRYEFDAKYHDVKKRYGYHFDAKQNGAGINVFYKAAIFRGITITPYLGMLFSKYNSGVQEMLLDAATIWSPEKVFKINISEEITLGYTTGIEVAYQMKGVGIFGAGIKYMETFDTYITINYTSPVTNETATAQTKGSYLSYYLTYQYLINPTIEKGSYEWQKLKKDDIYVEFGGIGGTVSLNYKHVIKSTESSKLGIRGGIGVIDISTNGVESLEFPVAISNSLGKRNHFFETEIGFRATKPYDPSPRKRRIRLEHAVFTGIGYKLEVRDRVIIKVVDYPTLEFSRSSSRKTFENYIGIAMGIKI